MSAIFKGQAGVILVAEEPAYDADSGTDMFDTTWAGSRAAIFGLATDLRAQGISFRTTQSGPVYMLTARVPTVQPDEVPPDRYEIGTETVSRDLFAHPSAVAEAANYDSRISDADQTFRGWAEDAAANRRSFQAGLWPVQESIVRHLKAGVTGFEVNFIRLRRFRQCPIEYANGAGRFALSASRLVYSTSQLNLPSAIAFRIPPMPSDAPFVFIKPDGTRIQDFAWGWKRTLQSCQIVGDYVEQTVELVLAPWSTLAYERATGPLAW
jgi:hypothetical protein